MIWFCGKTDCKTDHYNRAEPSIVTAAISRYPQYAAISTMYGYSIFNAGFGRGPGIPNSFEPSTHYYGFQVGSQGRLTRYWKFTATVTVARHPQASYLVAVDSLINNHATIIDLQDWSITSSFQSCKRLGQRSGACCVKSKLESHHDFCCHVRKKQVGSQYML